jgi:glutamate-1-semialdehyde 2,1-aminomutase
MSNGFAMSAIIGIESVMKSANSSFISSTNWTERVGPAAAIATIKIFNRENVTEHIAEIGRTVQDGWAALAQKNDLALSINTKGLPALASFGFSYPFARALNIEFTETMLEKGWLAHNQFKPSFSHSHRHVNRYLTDVDSTFKYLSTLVLSKEKELIEKSILNPAPTIPRLTR